MTNSGQEAPLSYLQVICYLESQGEDTDCLLFESGLLFRNSLDVSQRLACDVAFPPCNYSVSMTGCKF